jgi:hypothetical protein
MNALNISLLYIINILKFFFKEIVFTPQIVERVRNFVARSDSVTIENQN